MAVDLSTTYLGMQLRSPLVPSASPLSEDVGKIKRMEDSGAAAVVLYSLFEEQLERPEITRRVAGSDGQPLPLSDPYPHEGQYPTGPEEYLDHVRLAKEAVDIPVIASLNCSTMGRWAEYAAQIQQAGADALELNIYYVPTDLHVSGAQIENTTVNIVEAVRSQVNIPLAVKLSPYYSNTANLAYQLELAGADGLVLFNRFYQPDINLERGEVTSRILLSTPQAMRLPLRWVAILYGRVHTDLAATGGIHEPYDVAKMLMAGACVTQLCSVLLRRGIEYLRVLERELVRWMEEHKYESVQEMIGKMSQKECADPSAFERAHYIRSLRSYNRTGASGGVSPD